MSEACAPSLPSSQTAAPDTAGLTNNASPGAADGGSLSADLSAAKPSANDDNVIPKRKGRDRLYIVLLSIHGLIRGRDLELGRDADTGGQTLYVVQLARALGRHPDVARVDLLTRRVIDSKVSADYAAEEEPLSERARIVRIDCGPRRYLRKEKLWPHLDCFADNALAHLQRVMQETGLRASAVHGHYADAGYVAVQLANLLGTPLLQTGHSLGREKRRRLRDAGLTDDVIEERYAISTRIHAEEEALANAHAVIASTQQEIDTQYAAYANFYASRMLVIPPGTDITRFHAPRSGTRSIGKHGVEASITRFLRDPKRPMVLAIARPDERKNLHALIDAFAASSWLRQHANLTIVAGNRDDLRDLDRGARDVISGLLLAADRHDLWGQIALPKHHDRDEVSGLYQLAAATRGVFVNPALTEPFGLTLLEAAASGLPIIATNDGGPREIIARCRNGILVDPLDPASITNAIEQVLKDRDQWKVLSRNGQRGVREHFTWDVHARRYVELVDRLSKAIVPTQIPQRKASGRLSRIQRALITDIDNTLLGDETATRSFVRWLKRHRDDLIFGVATGRRLDSAAAVLAEHNIPTPDVWITSVGSEIHYGPEQVPDSGWFQHLNHRWEPDRIDAVFTQVDGIERQPEIDQRRFKRSYFVSEKHALTPEKLESQLFRNDLHAHMILSHSRYLDLLPVRAGKGLAVRYFAAKWGLSLEQIVVAGDSGNDEDMLRGRVLGVVVGNHQPELDGLVGFQRIYFAKAEYAAGILEGIEHFNERFGWSSDVDSPNDK
ncbi:MAG: HAD-IIB family hydrolase [Thioalkalivibrionaceae bacterium]